MEYNAIRIRTQNLLNGSFEIKCADVLVLRGNFEFSSVVDVELLHKALIRTDRRSRLSDLGECCVAVDTLMIHEKRGNDGDASA